MSSTSDSAQRATGFGSWPGENPVEALRVIFGRLGPEAEVAVPYLPYLPDRGPGSDAVGRSLGLLVDLPVDVQPSGWRLVDRPGRDVARAVSHLGADTDALAEVADGYTGSLTLGIVGPWTLAGTAWLPRGERVAADIGAARDLAGSLTEGACQHLAKVQRLVPGAALELVVDESGLPAALAGRLPTLSGFGRLRAVEPGVAEEALRELVAAVHGVGARVVLRCTTEQAPLPLLRKTGPDALAVNVAGLKPRVWEGLAVGIEDGMRVRLGVIDPVKPQHPDALAEAVVDRWEEVGLSGSDLDKVDLALAGGLAGVSAERASAALRELVQTTEVLIDKVR